MRNGIFMALFVGLISGHSHAAKTELCHGFLPENDLYIPEPVLASAVATGIPRSQFMDVLNRIAIEFRSEVAAKGGRLSVRHRWSDGTVNAFAERDGDVWYITMYGGMARHPAMTYDGFMSVACHEMGHHLGGAPLFTGSPWASVEGEADYFATLKCLRRMFLRDDNEAVLRGRSLDRWAVSRCEAEHGGKQDQLICIRSAMAALDLGAVMADLENGNRPKLKTPDGHEVTTTFEDHPRAQCRLDTNFQGALCRAPFSQPLSNRDYRVGSCADARTYARGLRPRCWFAP